jgi:hypothetical protein
MARYTIGWSPFRDDCGDLSGSCALFNDGFTSLHITMNVDSEEAIHD